MEKFIEHIQELIYNFQDGNIDEERFWDDFFYCLKGYLLRGTTPSK